MTRAQRRQLCDLAARIARKICDGKANIIEINQLGELVVELVDGGAL
jgi:hypothetical protein